MEPQPHDMKRPAPGPATVLPAEADSLNPSSTKRPRVWEPNGAEVSTIIVPERDTTILDVLNAHCWRLVLDYVSVRDVVRSERVSRGWQRVVRDYLAGVHEYQIINLFDADRDNSWIRRKTPQASKKYHDIHLPKIELFENMIQKIGPFCRKIFAVLHTENLKLVAANCPNLNKLVTRLMLSKEHMELRTKCLQNPLDVSIGETFASVLQQQRDECDNTLKEIVANGNLEELALVHNDLTTGSFLLNLKSNLKTLIISDCYFFLTEHIQSVADRLTGLTRFELTCQFLCALQNVHQLLENMPNLEILNLGDYEDGNHVRLQVKVGIELPTAISRLVRLRDLCLWNNGNVNSEWLAIVGGGCPALRSINIGRTPVFGKGVVELCRLRPELTQLVVTSRLVKEEDLEACARYCEGLEVLDVWYNRNYKTSLPARLAWPRARPLRLHLHRDLAAKIEVHYDGIIILSKTSRHEWWPD